MTDTITPHAWPPPGSAPPLPVPGQIPWDVPLNNCLIWLNDQITVLAADNAGKVPDGGLTGEVLTKASPADQDTIWAASSGVAGDVPTGGVAGDVLTKQTATNYDAAWAPPDPATMLVSSGANNVAVIGADGGVYVPNPVSTDVNNAAVRGTDAQVFVPHTNPVDMVSTDPGNLVTVGTDGKLFVPPLPPAQNVFPFPTAATVWTVTHTLGFYPNVIVVDANKVQIMPDELRYVDQANLTLTFSIPVSGAAVLS